VQQKMMIPKRRVEVRAEAVGKARSGPVKPAPDGPGPKLLVLETDYTLEGVRERELEHSILCRDLGGYFAHVWSVHPFATLVTSSGWAPKFGKPQHYPLAPRHTFIEGKVGRFAAFERLFALNFLLSQIDLFVRLRRLIRREGISAIRAANPLYASLFGLALARSTGIPLVIRVGANHDKCFETTGRPMEPRLMRSRKVEKLVERFVFKRADLVAGANEDNLSFALANGARRDRTTLFRYGNLVDARHFSEPTERGESARLLTELGLEPDRFLLYVGRLEPVKQPDQVVEVLARLRTKGFEIRALIAGEGRMRDELLNQARDLGVADFIVLPGNLSQSALALLYPAAAAVISPHTGRALAEAALGAAPVIAYDVDWQAELIENGKTGILVAQGDIAAMSEGAASLLADPGLAKQLGNALRARVLQMLDPDHLNEHERGEYRKLFQRQASVRR
jgi:glycosyltransferase involved in cell wall biosynthesis